MVADAPATQALLPLLSVWRARGSVRVLPWQHSGVDRPCAGSPGGGPDRAAVARLAELAADADALLVVAPRRRSPHTVLPGPVVTALDGRTVPVAFLPDTGAEALGRFAEAAAAVHRRAARPQRTAIPHPRAR